MSQYTLFPEPLKASPPNSGFTVYGEDETGNLYTQRIEPPEHGYLFYNIYLALSIAFRRAGTPESLRTAVFGDPKPEDVWNGVAVAVPQKVMRIFAEELEKHVGPCLVQTAETRSDVVKALKSGEGLVVLSDLRLLEHVVPGMGVVVYPRGLSRKDMKRLRKLHHRRAAAHKRYHFQP